MNYFNIRFNMKYLLDLCKGFLVLAVLLVGLTIWNKAEASTWRNNTYREVGSQINAAAVKSILGNESESIIHLKRALYLTNLLQKDDAPHAPKTDLGKLLRTRWKMKMFYAKYPQYWDTAIGYYSVLKVNRNY